MSLVWGEKLCINPSAIILVPGSLLRTAGKVGDGPLLDGKSNAQNRPGCSLQGVGRSGGQRNSNCEKMCMCMRSEEGGGALRG